eukprot:scaffold48809_cov75-Phaeocystis_antarctica.AAC.8
MFAQNPDWRQPPQFCTSTESPSRSAKRWRSVRRVGFRSNTKLATCVKGISDGVCRPLGYRRYRTMASGSVQAGCGPTRAPKDDANICSANPRSPLPVMGITAEVHLSKPLSKSGARESRETARSVLKK